MAPPGGRGGGARSSACGRHPYSHVHVIDAQFAVEVFLNVTAEPHGLRGGRRERENLLSARTDGQRGPRSRDPPTSPCLMDSAAALLRSWMGWLLYRVQRAPTMLPRNSTVYSFPYGFLGRGSFTRQTWRRRRIFGME